MRTHITTLYLTFLWIPLIPLSAHVVGQDGASFERVFGGRVPLSEAARRYRLFALLIVPAFFASLWYGTEAGLFTAAFFAILIALCVPLRRAYLDSWAKKREETA